REDLNTGQIVASGAETLRPSGHRRGHSRRPVRTPLNEPSFAVGDSDDAQQLRLPLEFGLVDDHDIDRDWEISEVAQRLGGIVVVSGHSRKNDEDIDIGVGAVVASRNRAEHDNTDRLRTFEDPLDHVGYPEGKVSTVVDGFAVDHLECRECHSVDSPASRRRSAAIWSRGGLPAATPMTSWYTSWFEARVVFAPLSSWNTAGALPPR